LLGFRSAGFGRLQSGRGLQKLTVKPFARRRKIGDLAFELLSPRGGVDVCDASFRLLDFFAQGMHEELDRAFSASAPSAGAVCLLFALYRYCMETICIPLFSDMKRAKRKLAAIAEVAPDAALATPALLSRHLRCREACEPRAVADESSPTPPSTSSPAVSVVALAPSKTSPAPAVSVVAKTSPAPAPSVSVIAPAPAPALAPAPSRGRQAVQCWYRGRRYDSITETKVSVFLHELSRAYGGASLSLDIKPGVVEVAGLLQLLRARVGNESYVPDALESSRWYPDFALCLSGFNYWVEVKYHATRLLIGEQEKYHVVGAADRPVLLISVDNGCIQPPYSTGRREYTSSSASASPSASFGTSSAGVTMTCFRGGRRYDVVFAERADGAIDLFPCPEDLRAVRALAWNAPKLLAAYSAAHGVERVYCARPDAESTSNPTLLCIQQQA